MSVAQWLNKRQNEAVINDEKVRKNEVLLSFKHAKAFQEEIKPLNEGDKFFMYKFNNLYSEAMFEISAYLQKYDLYEQAILSDKQDEAKSYLSELDDTGKFVLKYSKLANFLKQYLNKETSAVINQVYLKMDEMGDLVSKILEADYFNDDIDIIEKQQLEKIKNDIITRYYSVIGHSGSKKKYERPADEEEQEDGESLASDFTIAGSGHSNLNGIYTGSSVPPFIFNWEKNDPYRHY